MGLFFFEIYGIYRCTYLILVGADLEKESRIEHGQFRDHPPPVLGFIAEPMAAGIIYPAVMAAWSYIAMYFYDGCSTSIAFPLAASVFLIFASLMVWYQKWLMRTSLPKKPGMTKPDTASCVDNTSTDLQVPKAF
jgi:hypothetical protein